MDIKIIIDKIVKWCEDNHITEDSTFDYDGYNVNSDSIGVCFTNYDNKRYNFYINDSSYSGGIGLFKLICYEDDYNRWDRDIPSGEIFSYNRITEKGLNKLKQWLEKNTNFTPLLIE